MIGRRGRDEIYRRLLDTVNSGAGNDRIDGGETVDGGDGDDLLVDSGGSAQGGPGNDRIIQRRERSDRTAARATTACELDFTDIHDGGGGRTA